MKPKPTPERLDTHTRTRTLPAVPLLLVMILFAAVVRLYHLDTLPAGLHHDEASNGMLALRILAGERPVFFSEYTGKEAGYMYLVALAISLTGQTIFAIRVPAALAGVALVPAIFLAGRRAIGEYGALLAAGVTAAAPWLIHINRIGFRASLLPLLLTVWAWLLLRGLDTLPTRRMSYGNWFLAGGALGSIAWTYTASRVVPLLVVLFLLYLVWWHRPVARQQWRGIVLMLATSALVAAPLFVHFVRTPADWGERLEQIGACSNLTAGACVFRIVDHTWATLAMIGWRGDPMGFFNLPDAPALPLAVGWLFVVGGVCAVWRFREPPIALLLLWWGVMVLPGILSQDSPHFLRTIGAAPPTMLLWALPLAMLAALADRAHTHLTRGVRAGLRLLPPVLVVLVAVFSTRDYFVRWAARPDLYYEYMGYATDTAHVADGIPPDVDLYISEEYYRHPTYRYLAPRTETARWFDVRYGWPLAYPGSQSLYLISPATPVDSRVDVFIQGAIGENMLNEQGQWAATSLHMPVAPHITVAPEQPPMAPTRLGGVWFQGATVGDRQPDGTLPVTLFWQVEHPVNQELRVFLHLVDAGGTMIAQHDVIGYPSREWRAGDQFVTLHTLEIGEIPDSTTRSPHAFLLVGLYDVVSGERVPIAEADDGQAERDKRAIRLELDADVLLP